MELRIKPSRPNIPAGLKLHIDRKNTTHTYSNTQSRTWVVVGIGGHVTDAMLRWKVPRHFPMFGACACGRT